MNQLLKTVLVCASLFAAAPAFAKTLTCRSNSASIVISVDKFGFYGGASAADSIGKDLQSGQLTFIDNGPSHTSTYSLVLNATDDYCIFYLPNQILKKSPTFVTSLVCDKLTKGQPDPMECRLAD